MRLDQELVIRGLARSRTQAARLVAEGRVKVSGAIARKPAMSVDTETDISADTEKWVSRAAYKLLGAIEESGTSMDGRVLDAGGVDRGDSRRWHWCRERNWSTQSTLGTISSPIRSARIRESGSGRA